MSRKSDIAVVDNFLHGWDENLERVEWEEVAERESKIAHCTLTINGKTIKRTIPIEDYPRWRDRGWRCWYLEL